MEHLLVRIMRGNGITNLPRLENRVKTLKVGNWIEVNTNGNKLILERIGNLSARITLLGYNGILSRDNVSFSRLMNVAEILDTHFDSTKATFVCR